MGSEAYTWVTKYRENLADALRAAREETFAAGKFLGAEDHPASIEEAVELDPDCGTGSLLEIVGVSATPDFLCASRLSREELLGFFGTERPTFEEIGKCSLFWESIDRGEARAVVLYEQGRPEKICFAAWTIDSSAAGSGSFEELEKTGRRRGGAESGSGPAKKGTGKSTWFARLGAILGFFRFRRKEESPGSAVSEE